MRGARRAGRAATLAVAAVLMAGAAAAQTDVSLPLGSKAPDAVLHDLDGNEVRLGQVIAGRPALLEIWATWCPLCQELQPQLDRIHAERGDDLAMVAVAVAVNQNPRRIKRHLERHDPGYPHLFDTRGEAVRGFKATTTSIVVLLDAEGRVVYTGVGADQDLRAAVDALLGS